ncbi:MAG: MBL fold metallo-hydrolase [Helicobacter sp.]|nr:MBL fold metallo-hydrolase [Helicobacter sp.]
MIVFENNVFEVLRMAFGEYQTNCYLVIDKQNGESLIVDPGINAEGWVLDHVRKPLAILNTHGHFDHTWSNAALKNHFADASLLCPFEDVFMLHEDDFGTGVPPSFPDILVGAKEGECVVRRVSDVTNLGRSNKYNFGGFCLEFICYPGHTPGCSVIVLEHRDYAEKIMFSGDFIFHRSIGRTDFPYGSSSAMKKSLESFLNFKEDMLMLPGHGESTRVLAEKENIPYWIQRL